MAEHKYGYTGQLGEIFYELHSPSYEIQKCGFIGQYFALFMRIVGAN